MSGITIDNRSTGVKAGWWLLLVMAALGALSNFMLIFVTSGHASAIAAWSALYLYAVFVLLNPYREGKRWAWNLTWVLPVPPIVLAITESDGRVYFLIAAGLMILGQILTRNAFFGDK